MLREMEDGTDARRGSQIVAVSSKQASSCWPTEDMHCQPGSSNFPSGAGASSGGSRLSRMEETGEFWPSGRICGQDVGKAPDCSRPVLRKPSQMSTKLVAARSSGGRRPHRAHHGSSVQGQWNALQGFSGNVDEPAMGGMDTDGNLGIGLNTRLGLSEVPALAHGSSNTSSELSLGRSNVSANGNSDLYAGRCPVQAGSGPDFVPPRASGLSGDKSGRNGSSSTTVAGLSAVLPTGLEGRLGDLLHVPPVTSSNLMDPQDMDEQCLRTASTSNCNVLSEAFLSGGSNSQSALGVKAACNGEAHLFPCSDSMDRSLGADTHSFKGNFLGTAFPTSSSNIMGSSRSSSCKRKSCTTGVSSSLSCRSGSPHTSGGRESCGLRGMGGRRSSSNLGCGSVSDCVASASAVTIGRCADSSVAVAASTIDEPRSRKGATARDGDGVMGRSTKTTTTSCASNGSTSRSLRGTSIVQAEHLHTPMQPPFTRTVRRAIPALQPESWCPRRGPSVECPTDPDTVTACSSNPIARSGEQVGMTIGTRRSSSPSTTTGRSGSDRHNDNIGAERLSTRFTGNNSRSSAVSAGAYQFGNEGRFRFGNEGRFRLRSNGHNNADPTTNPSPQSPVSPSGLTPGPSPSRPPPHPPLVRPRPHLSTLHPSMLSPPSGPAPSRMAPSPPGTTSLSTALDLLPPGSSIFQSSLLPRSSSVDVMESRSERGLESAAESLLGTPFRGLHSSHDGENQPRLVAESLAEFLLALDRVERDEDLTYEQLLMLEATLLFGGMGLHDQHSDLRLDVDNMSYEELLALEERIGNVSTGLSVDTVNKCLKRSRYSSQAAAIACYSQESDMKCSICQEEYGDGDELGRIDCGHSYHVACIKQWLLQKNQCPICKASAL